MSSSPTPAPHQPRAVNNFSQTVRKALSYHFQVFILIMALVVSYMIFNTYQILSQASDEAYYTSKKSELSSDFDLESLRTVNRLYLADEAKDIPTNPESLINN